MRWWTQHKQNDNEVHADETQSAAMCLQAFKLSYDISTKGIKAAMLIWLGDSLCTHCCRVCCVCIRVFGQPGNRLAANEARQRAECMHS